MAEVGDIFKVVMHTMLDGVDDIANVFFYRMQTAHSASLNPAEILAGAFASDVAGDITRIMHTTGTVYQIDAENLFSVDEFYSESVSLGGQYTGEVLPRFVAAGFHSNRSRKDVRRGQKRIAPISEDLIDGDDYTSVNLTLLGEVAARLGATIDEGLGVTQYAPVVLKRIAYTTPAGKLAYRLPESQSEAIYFYANDWSATRPTTQNSRKN